jgi:flagellar basal-body rod modification protein FlgD
LTAGKRFKHLFQKLAKERMKTMSAVGGVDAASSSNSTGISTAGQKEVTSADFMKLLIAQLQNQDPTSPVDNQQFVTQLATFNSLEQLVSINNNVTKLANQADTSSEA